MKFTIEGFSQAFAMTLKKEVEIKGKKVVKQIDCTDLVILRWFVDFYPNMKKIEVDGKQYAWLTHKKLQEDLPIVDINKRSFIDRMQKLVDFEILDYRLVKEGGTFSLYGFGKNYAKLISDKEGMQSNDIGGCDQTPQGMQSNDIGVDGQPNNKDISIINSSIKDSSIINTGESPKRKRFVPPTLEEVKAYCIERKNNVDAQRFIDYYTSNGWLVGKNKMKDWKAAVRTWERNGYSQPKSGANGIAINETKSDLENLF